MATRTIANGGGNWNSTGTWVEGVVPVAGDAVVATATSGNLTITASAASASCDFTNYVGTLTFNAGLTITSTFKLVAGMTLAGSTGTLVFNGTATITSAGKQIPIAVQFLGASTYTFADDFQTNAGTLTLGNSSNALVLNGHNLIANGSAVTFNTSGTISGTTVLQVIGALTLSGSAASPSINININAGSNTVTWSGSIKYLTGTLTYTSGTVTGVSSPVLSITGSCTLNTGTMLDVANIQTTLTAALTLTFSSGVSLGGFTLPNAAVTFAGSDFHVGGTFNNTALTAARTYTVTAGMTITFDGMFISLAGTTGSHAKFVSSSPGTKYKLVLPQPANAPGAGSGYAPIFCDFTDCDATGGLPVISYGGVISSCFNCYNTYPPPSIYPAPRVRNIGSLS